jgi:hypothetical protein
VSKKSRASAQTSIRSLCYKHHINVTHLVDCEPSFDPVTKSLEAKPGVREKVCDKRGGITGSESPICFIESERCIVVVQSYGRFNPSLDQGINLRKSQSHIAT